MEEGESGSLWSRRERRGEGREREREQEKERERESCLLYTSDAADER